MHKKRVVITGMGTVNPIGNDIESTRLSLLAGRNGIGEITRYPLENRAIHLAAEIKNLDFSAHISTKELRRMDLFTTYALIAAREAYEDSALDVEEVQTSTRNAVILSSGIGGMGTMEEEVVKGYENAFDRISPFFIPKVISNMGAAKIAMEFGIHGEATCPVTACAGGTNAIGDAFRKIKDGYADFVIAGGTEAAITQVAMGGFTSMKALASATDPDRASIPFDKERSGFVMGEGAAVLVLEELEHALARKAKIYAEVAGYGMTCDAFHITSPSPDGVWAAEAMKEALNEAEVRAEDLDSINAHATSTTLNDLYETKAIKLALGDSWSRVLVNGTKSMTGHLLGAAGALEVIIAVLELRDGFIAPTINYRVEDPECDLNIVKNEVVYKDIKTVLSNSLGFGGHNYSLLLKKWEV